MAKVRTGDPIADLLLDGQIRAVEEAAEAYLNARIDEVVHLVESDLSDAEFRRHPLIMLLMAHGSRGFEDSLL